jgi:TRAP-type C4-dicarboxylate transport system permease small subunit
MSEYLQTVLIIIYRLMCLLVGAFFAYLGYKLYIKANLDKEQELKIQAGKDKLLLLRRFAPGIFFVLCGVVIAFTGVFRQIVVQHVAPLASGVSVNADASRARNSSNCGTYDRTVMQQSLSSEPSLSFSGHKQNKLAKDKR